MDHNDRVSRGRFEFSARLAIFPIGRHVKRPIAMSGFQHFTTDALPERDRLAIWSEMFARYVAKMQFAPVGAQPYSQNAVLRKLPGLSLVSACCTGFRATRTRELIADGNDDMVLVVNVTGTSQCRPDRP